MKILSILIPMAALIGFFWLGYYSQAYHEQKLNKSAASSQLSSAIQDAICAPKVRNREGCSDPKPSFWINKHMSKLEVNQQIKSLYTEE